MGSLNSARDALADAVSTVTGLTGYAEQPAVLTPGVAWPLLASLSKPDGFMEAEWRVVAVLGSTAAAALDSLDALADEIEAALSPVMYVESITPVSVAAGSGELHAVEIRGRREL